MKEHILYIRVLYRKDNGMSKELEYILDKKKAYKIIEYETKDLNLKDILTYELKELGNMDIIFYMNEHKMIDLSIYDLSENELIQMKEKYYDLWLKANNTTNTKKNRILFVKDCNSKKYKAFIDNIILDVQDSIEKAFNNSSNNITAEWINKPKSNTSNFELPEKFLILSDLGKYGILISYLKCEVKDDIEEEQLIVN